jgi:hypothetical protein
MVLVEQGPWDDPIDLHLRRLQERLYDSIDAALDGQLAKKFPESKGKTIIIQLDGYNLPRADVARFFDRFSTAALSTRDYERALINNPFVAGIAFRAQFDSIN